MDEVRLINATPLEKEMREYSQYIGRETTNECESTAECCADMVSEAPTIDPESLRPCGAWQMVRSSSAGTADAKRFLQHSIGTRNMPIAAAAGAKWKQRMKARYAKNDDDTV